jgi:S1-C subfamily serine protease
VISAPRNSSLGLKGGDVVLAVDGRRPEGPLHLIRILRSYDDGEPFKLELLRSRKRETLTGSLTPPADER